MARSSLIIKNIKRKNLAKRYEAKRSKFSEIAKNKEFPAKYFALPPDHQKEWPDLQ